jgi:hypothetical protein
MDVGGRPRGPDDGKHIPASRRTTRLAGRLWRGSVATLDVTELPGGHG